MPTVNGPSGRGKPFQSRWHPSTKQACSSPSSLSRRLAYIQSNNLAGDQTKALDAQYAIWQLRGATNSPAGGAQAKAVVDAATTPPANPEGTSIIDAAEANQVRLTVTSWQPIGQKVPLGAASDNFYGQGTLNVENTSNQKLTLFMPIATLFPPAATGSQTMAGYSTNVQVTIPVGKRRSSCREPVRAMVPMPGFSR